MKKTAIETRIDIINSQLVKLSELYGQEKKTENYERQWKVLQIIYRTLEAKHKTLDQLKRALRVARLQYLSNREIDQYGAARSSTVVECLALADTLDKTGVDALVELYHDRQKVERLYRDLHTVVSVPKWRSRLTVNIHTHGTRPDNTRL